MKINMLEELKYEVCQANLRLKENGLAILTWGNVSAINEDRTLVAIKPSGVEYACITPDKIVVTDLKGNVIEGELRPSSDLKTHLKLYEAFSRVNSVVHTHSAFATAIAQAELDIPCMGTTHADTFYGNIPCTRALTEQEVTSDYEYNTGVVIAETFIKRRIDPEATPGVLVCKHGPFAWGSSCAQAVEHALILEEVARLAHLTWQANPKAAPAPNYLLDKHYLRKHGKNAYYGQR